MDKLQIGMSVFMACFAVLMAVGCDSPAGPNGPSWLKAVVQADSTTRFDGTGIFTVGPGPAYGAEVKFSVVAEVEGDSQDEDILLTRPGEGRPPEGEYELGLLRPEGQTLVGFRALYLYWSELEGSRNYTSTSGWVQITHSSDERVEGEFRITGRLYCESEPGQVWRGYECNPQVPLADGDTIVVEGSFSLASPDPGAVRPDV